MRCKYCGAVFHGEGLKYCPYCDNDIEPEERTRIVYVPASGNISDYELERRNRVAPLVPEGTEWGELHFTVLKGKGSLSPADGSHYFIVVDEYYETEILSGESDRTAVIRLPYGNHILKVRMFPYDDDGFFHEAEYGRHDNIGFTIGDRAVRMELDQGSLLKPQKIRVY